MREQELLKEARQPAVDGAVALAARLLGERTREVRLADAGRAGDENVDVVGDPSPGGQLAHEAAFDLSLRRAVDIFEARPGDAELRFPQRPRNALVVAGKRLCVDEHSEAAVEVDLPRFRPARAGALASI